MSKSIGRFQIQRLLGQGTQGVVRLCHDPHLDREVAIKSIHPQYASNKKALQHLQQEARAISRLQHPNIVTLYEAVVAKPQMHLVFEYIKGPTLKEYLKQHSPDLERDLPLFRQILAGLSQAHQQGIVHCDLKPANIILDEAQHLPKVMDFGIAQLQQGPGPQARSKKFVGTPRYSAPEYITQRASSPASDVYSLGLICYELLTGIMPIQGDETKVILHNVITNDIPDPHEHNPAIDQELSAIIFTALNANVSKRFSNATQMLGALDNYLNRRQQPSSNHSTIEFILRKIRRNKDFPAMAGSVQTISKLNADDDNFAAHLAAEILKDFALTKKILQVVNSAFYGQYAGSITTISRAIVILGLDSVRTLATSLLLVEQLNNQAHASELRDAVLGTLFSGLLAQQVCQHHQLNRHQEEFFICAMLQKLGRLLVLFYLHDDSQDIQQLMQEQQMDEGQASQEVLGVSYHAIGAAIAEEWNLPSQVIQVMRALPDEPLDTAPQGLEDKLHYYCHFANDVTASLNQSNGQPMAKVLEHYQHSVELDQSQCQDLLSHAAEHFQNFTQSLSLDIKQSPLVKQLSNTQSWQADAHNNQEASSTHTDYVEPSAEEILKDAIQAISQLIRGNFKLNDVFNIMLESLYRGVICQRVLLCLRDNRSKSMQAKIGFGDQVDNLIPKFCFPTQYTPDPFHIALHKKVDVHIDNTRDIRFRSRLPDWYLRHVDAGAFMLLPVVVNQSTIGLIYADSATPQGFQLSSKRLELVKQLRVLTVSALQHYMKAS